MNVGSEDILEITSEIKPALARMKNGRALGIDGITAEMMRLSGSVTIVAI